MSLARSWRTVRHLRSGQIRALLVHRLRGPVAPRPWVGPAPALRVRAPAVPFFAPPAHVHFDGARSFELLNREVEFPGAVDWSHAGEGPLWAYHLHQFDYLRAPQLRAGERAALVFDWIERHPSGVGWSPHPTSVRILNWIKLLLTPGALALDELAEQRMTTSLGVQAKALSSRLETHLLANHYVTNLLALVFAGIALDTPEADRWQAHQEALRAEIDAQILPDGAHLERSPMYHSLLLEWILDLVNLASAARDRVSEPLERTLRVAAARMLGALRVWTHPDGRIALFGDSVWGIAQEPEALSGYAAALGIGAAGSAGEGVLRDAGFVRLAAGPFHVIASVAGPMPAYQPGHAHADALAFELSVGSERLVTDTGVTEYVEGPLREASRATRSHATAEIDGQDQAELWAAHRVGGRPRVELVTVEPRRSLEATCAGWATPGTLHRRRFQVDERVLRIHDSVEGRPRLVRLVLPLAPGLEPKLTGETAWVRLRDGRLVQISLPRGMGWKVERLPYFPEFGRVIERAGLVGEGARLPTGTWLIRVAST